MIDDIIGNDEYTIDMISDPTVLDKSCDYVPAMHMLKSDSSLWYETYKESKLNIGIMNDYLVVIGF